MLFSDQFQTLHDRIKSHSLPDIALMHPTLGIDDIEDAKYLSRLLINSWSAEYALRITPVVNDERYLQSSLHWTFPQAYYSVLFCARAFLWVFGSDLSNEDNIQRRIGHFMNLYPKSLSFYAYGMPDVHMSENLHDIADGRLIMFLIETRQKQFDYFRKTSVMRDVSGPISNVYQHFNNEVARTTYFDLLQRLRISSTNFDLEQLSHLSNSLRDFHDQLTVVVAHVNSVHECYVAQSLGLDRYRDLVNKAPSYLKDGFVLDRFHTLIIPNVERLQSESTTHEPMD